MAMPAMAAMMNPGADAQQGAAPGAPPFGQSPVTQPTPNAGLNAAGVARLSLIMKMMEEALPMVGAATEPGKDVLKALSLIAKHIPAGTVSPANQQNQLQNLMLQQAQQGPMVAQLRQAMAGGGAGRGAPPMAAA